MLGVHHPVGGKTQRAASDESAEQKHHGVTLLAFHRDPQCDKT